MTNIEDWLKALETGIEERGKLDKEQKGKLYHKITSSYQALKDQLTVEEALDLQKAAMQARRYYTCLLINRDVREAAVAQRISDRWDIASGRQDILTAIYGNLSGAGVLIFMELPGLSEAQRCTFANFCLVEASNVTYQYRVGPPKIEVIRPDEYQVILGQISYLKSALYDHFRSYSAVVPPPNPSLN